MVQFEQQIEIKREEIEKHLKVLILGDFREKSLLLDLQSSSFSSNF